MSGYASLPPDAETVRRPPKPRVMLSPHRKVHVFLAVLAIANLTLWYAK